MPQSSYFGCSDLARDSSVLCAQPCATLCAALRFYNMLAETWYSKAQCSNSQEVYTAAFPKEYARSWKAF